MLLRTCRRLAATASAVGAAYTDAALACAGAATGIALGCGLCAVIISKDVLKARPCRRPLLPLCRLVGAPQA